MKITTVLVDLDGTLLPMDQEVFVRSYLGLLAKFLAPHGYDPKALVDSIWAGTGAMVKNDGSIRNEEVFWNKFASIFGEEARKDEPLFRTFYETVFPKVQASCGFDPRAAEVIAAIRSKSLDVVLATNPIFPAIATSQRIHWAGLNPEDFRLYTTYENSCHCKPSLAYYQDVLDALGLQAEECLMVGNDVGEDMVAEKLGMKVFLLTHSLIHRGLDYSGYPQGGFEDLLAYLETI